MVAEREGFEPSIRFWRILTFQASAFDHSATAPHALEAVHLVAWSEEGKASALGADARAAGPEIAASGSVRYVVDPAGQRDVLGGDPAVAMGGEQYVDAVPHVAPLGVVIGLFRLQRDPGHEAEGGVEIGEPEAFGDAVPCPVERPAGQARQRGFPLVLAQYRHASSSFAAPALCRRWMARGQTFAPDAAAIERLAEAAIARLPGQFSRHLANVVLRVEDFADDAVLAEMGIADPFELTGLYSGRSLDKQDSWVSGELPPMIHLYRRPLLDEWVETGVGLEALITHVIVHEVGHHFGFSDADMHALEDAAE
jgi:predicted Zn-dependent protease with MMP-like domain